MRRCRRPRLRSRRERGELGAQAQQSLRADEIVTAPRAGTPHAIFFDVDFTLIHPGRRSRGADTPRACARHGSPSTRRSSTPRSPRPRTLSTWRAVSTIPRSSSTTRCASSKGWAAAGPASRRRPGSLDRLVGVPSLLALRRGARGAARPARGRLLARSDPELAASAQDLRRAFRAARRLFSVASPRRITAT